MYTSRSFAVAVVFLLAIFLASPVEGKRGPPPSVKPIALNGVLYKATYGLAPGKGGSRDYIVEAWDEKRQTKLWDVTVYAVKFKKNLEFDVQEDFIAKIEIDGGKLIVTSERGETFIVDISTHRVTEESSGR